MLTICILVGGEDGIRTREALPSRRFFRPLHMPNVRTSPHRDPDRICTGVDSLAGTAPSLLGHGVSQMRVGRFASRLCARLLFELYLLAYLIRNAFNCWQSIMPKRKKQRGRPPVKSMPEPIPDTPENIAQALLTTPPKKEGDWKYKKEGRD